MPQISRNDTRIPFLHPKCRARSRDIPQYLLGKYYDMGRSWWTDAHMGEAEQGLVILHQVCKHSLAVLVGWRLYLKRSDYKVTTSFSAARDMSIESTRVQVACKKSLCKNTSTSSKQLPEENSCINEAIVMGSSAQLRNTVTAWANYNTVIFFL